MDEETFLFTSLNQFYNAHLVTLQRLHSDNGNRIYRLDMANNQRWVLRLFAADDESALQLADVLSFLEQQGYSAEQLVHAVNGDVLVRYEDNLLLMTHFIEGSPIDYSPSTLYLLGKVLGKLHTLNTVNALELPKAEMLPAPELSYALSELAKVAEEVPELLQKHYDVLVNAIYGVNRCENAPVTIIHNDCHPANAILTSSKQVKLIDWYGAGLGPAVIDVGFLLVSCEIPFLGTPQSVIDAERIPTIIDGYCQYHTLTAMELDLLPDAIRFRSLVYGAVSFAHAISEQRVEKYDNEWWWLRYQAADDIADRARTCFEKYL
jgi:Ser/Thr protein kinase RdoA (MazF antagonist)